MSMFMQALCVTEYESGGKQRLGRTSAQVCGVALEGGWEGMSPGGEGMLLRTPERERVREKERGLRASGWRSAGGGMGGNEGGTGMEGEEGSTCIQPFHSSVCWRFSS